MNNVKKWLGMINCIIVLLTGSSVVADVIKIPPDADTYIDGYSGNEDTNYGTNNILWIRQDADGAQRALLHFPLDAISDIPVSTITQVTLNIYMDNWGGAPRHDTHRIGTDWTEAGATWNNANDFQEAYGSFTPTHNAWLWYSPDVTALVKAWINGTYANYGIGIQFGWDNQYKNSQIISREDSDPELHPYLEVDYTPQPVTLALLMFGLGGILFRKNNREK